MDFITDRVNSQISIFRVTNVPRPIEDTQKRRRCSRPTSKPSPKRVKSVCQIEVSRHPGVPLNEKHLGEADGVNSHVSDNNRPDNLDSLNLNQEIHVRTRQLSHCPTGDSGLSVLLDGPVGRLSEIDSYFGSAGPVSNTQSDGELEPDAAINTPIQANKGPGFSQDLALSIPVPSNSAHLIDGFHVESMANEINAAQLMQNFYLGDFDRTGNIDAAQLMQQFDWFDGNYNF